MPSRVYIGNLSRSCRERDVERFFKGYGRLREVALKSGYGFVQFEDARDADDACHDLDGKELVGERVRVEMARERRGRSPRGRSPRRGGGGDRGGGDDRGGIRKGIPPGRKTNYRLVVENMSSKTSWQDLKDYFRTCGEITFTNAHKPRQGEGLVEFGDRRSMEYALDKLDDTELDGKRIRLTEEGQGGSGRKRSYSRSRSPRSRSPRSRSPRSRSRSRSRSRDRGGAGGRSSSRD